MGELQRANNGLRSYMVALATLLLVFMLGLGIASGEAKAPKAPGGERPYLPGEHYADIEIKPYGVPGVVNELNLMVHGPDSSRNNGDAYSPEHVGNGDPTTLNLWHVEQPYGYLYRIDVPPEYKSEHLLVEIFDADSYNRTGTPPPFPPTPSNTQTPVPTVIADVYASCTNPRPGECTSNVDRSSPGMKLNAFSSGRTAFWRVDDIRNPYTTPTGNNYQDAYTTQTQYTLWHFRPSVTDPFADPSVLSDQPGGAYLARYTGRLETATDLNWYQPDGFDIQLTGCAQGDCFQREAGGWRSFYLYVQSVDGSSENNFDLRAGPPELNAGGCATPCYVNQLYFTNAPDWQDGGTKIYAKHALPINMNIPGAFPLVMTRVRKELAGQTLGIRHFDQDCFNGCGSTMQYQMQICGCDDPQNPDCWLNVGAGHIGPNDGWATSGYPDPEPIQIPMEGSSEYNLLFGSGGECPSSRFRIAQNPSYSQDSTTWQILVDDFNRDNVEYKR
jgi:hypothetical protein